MAVTYPRKLVNNIGPREVMAAVVKERKVQMLFLNSYRFNEQRSCQELAVLIEALDGQPRDLCRELSHPCATRPPARRTAAFARPWKKSCRRRRAM